MNNPLKFTLYLKVIERVLSINCIPMSVGGSVTTLTMSGFLFDERLNCYKYYSISLNLSFFNGL